MGKNMRNIPHVRQSDVKRNCGAACICMLLQSYGLKGKLNDVTNEISVMLDGIPSCRNQKMIEYALSRKIACCAVSVKDLKSTIPLCITNEIDVVISYRPDIDKPYGHFSVVTGYDDSFVYINDPQKDSSSGKGYAISFESLAEMMKADPRFDEIIVDNTLLLFANPKLNVETTTIFRELSGQTESVSVFSSVLPEIQKLVFPFGNEGIWLDL